MTHDAREDMECALANLIEPLMTSGMQSAFQSSRLPERLQGA